MYTTHYSERPVQIPWYYYRVHKVFQKKKKEKFEMMVSIICTYVCSCKW